MAELVRTERERKGWTLEDLATESGLAKATIFRIEKGETLPRGATRRKLADALGVPVETLRQHEQLDEMTTPLDPGAADLLRTLRRVWPELDATQQLDLLQQALDLRKHNRVDHSVKKTEAS